MNRATVRWYAEAEAELAQIWLSSADQATIEDAANEIDALLTLAPASKGRPFALATLDADSIRLLEQRVGVLPEDLRWLRCGPLELFFQALEDDAMVLVMHVRRRRDRLY